MDCEISLVVSTLNRTTDLESLFLSLLVQDFKNFRIILVDQNKNGLVDSIVHKFQDKIQIEHKKVDFKGASRARNYGLSFVQTEYVAFPDDDCEYFPNTLSKVIDIFKNNIQLSGLSGKSVDKNGNFTNLKKWSNREYLIDEHSCWYSAIEYTMFFKTNSINAFNGFSENIGPGADSIYKCGEGTELLIKLIKSGNKFLYTPNVEVYHPDAIFVYDQSNRLKLFTYSLGMGYVLKKHFSTIMILKYLIRPFFGFIISLFLFRKIKFVNFLLMFLGRFTAVLIN